MSGTAGTTLACPHCGSSDIQRRGTNVRAGRTEPHHICRDCGRRTTNIDRRQFRREPPDKPSNGLARKLWEMGEEEAAGGE